MLAIAWMCLASLGVTTHPVADTSRSGLEQVSIEVPGQGRKLLYWLDRPAGYGLSDRPALLIVLHGTDDTAADAIQFWSTRQHELPILIAAPQSVGKGWSDEDVPALGLMLDDLRRRAPFDQQRILLAGFSAGGVMTMHMLYAEGWPLCAAAALANYVPPRLTARHAAAKHEVPVFYAVGMTDINHERMRVGLELLRSAGANIDQYRPQIGHVLDPQVGQAAMDWLLLHARRAVTARIDAVKNVAAPQSAAVLESVIDQSRWHDPANVDAAGRALEKLETAGRQRLAQAETAEREGRELEALDLLSASDADCLSGHLRNQVAHTREKLLRNPDLKTRWEEHRRKQRNDQAFQLYVGAQRLVANQQYEEAASRCEQVLRDYADTPAAERARYLADLLRDNRLAESR